MSCPGIHCIETQSLVGIRGLQCETNLLEIMGLESFDVVRFDLGPLLQGQTRIAKLKSAYNSLIIGPRGLQCQTNLLEIMGRESSDVVRFDLGPLLQVKWCFTGFGELSFWWIQICIGSPMRRSSLFLFIHLFSGFVLSGITLGFMFVHTFR